MTTVTCGSKEILDEHPVVTGVVTGEYMQGYRPSTRPITIIDSVPESYLEGEGSRSHTVKIPAVKKPKPYFRSKERW